MSYIVPMNAFPRMTRLKSASAAMNANPYTADLPAKQPRNGNGANMVAQLERQVQERLGGLEASMAAVAEQLSPAARQRITPDVLANAALSYQNFSFRPGIDNPSGPPIDAENGSIEGPVVLKNFNSTPASIGTAPAALSISIPLLDSDQTLTGGGRMITALGLALAPTGDAADLPAGYDAKSLKSTLLDLGLVQVLTGATIKAQYDARDLYDTRFLQRVLEQPIRVQKGNYSATVFRFVTVAPPPAAAQNTYSLTVVFTSYWPPIR